METQDKKRIKNAERMKEKNDAYNDFTTKSKTITFSGSCGSKQYMTIEKNGVEKTYVIGSNQCRDYITSQQYLNGGKTSKHVIDHIIDLLRGFAVLKDLRKKVYIRVGRFFDDIYIHTYDQYGNFIKINKSGWEIVKKSPVPFLQPQKQLPQPLPKPCTPQRCYQLLSGIANLKIQSEVVLLFTALLQFLNIERGAMPILLLEGGQGVGKSLLAHLLKLNIDGTNPNLFSPPTSISDILAITSSTYLLAFDNCSTINAEMADMFCRISTGGGIIRRKLYSDDDEVVSNIQRPCILNGITEPTKRPDFLDRCIVLSLKKFEGNRKSEQLVLSEFQDIYPELLGGLYETLSKCLAVLDTIQTHNLPRMTETARMGIALEKVLGLPDGTFLNIYNANLNRQANTIFWEDEVCCEIHRILTDEKKSSKIKSTGLFPSKALILKGTADEILRMIKSSGRKADKTNFPRTAKGFSDHIKRMEPVLNQMGIIVVKIPRTSLRRDMWIKFKDDLVETSTEPDIAL